MASTTKNPTYVGKKDFSSVGSSAFDSNGNIFVAAGDKSNDALQAEINRNWQRDEREAVQQFEIDMWNLNNEYNSPLAQVQRLKEAGLNPTSMSNNGSTGNSSSPVTSSFGSGAQASGSHSMADFASILNGTANIANVTSNAVKAVAEKRNLDSQTNLNEQQRQWNDATYDKRVESAYKAVDKISADINESISRKNKNDSSANLDYYSAEEIKAGIPYIAQKSSAEIDVVKETANKIRTETSLNKELENKAKAETKYINKQEEQFESSAEADRYSKSMQGRYYGELSETENDNQPAKQVESAYNALETKYRYEFSQSLGCPVNAPEFVFFWRLNQQGLFNQYVDEVMLPTERSKWKPNDYYQSVLKTNPFFNTRVGTYNPSIGSYDNNAIPLRSK